MKKKKNKCKDYIWGIYNQLNISFDAYNRHTRVSQVGQNYCVGTGSYIHSYCCNGGCCPGDCHSCERWSCLHHTGYRYLQQLCLTNGNTRRCYDIWQDDNYDARVDMWNHALQGARDFNAVWDVTGGFRWIYWLY